MAESQPSQSIDHNQLDTVRARALFALGIVFPPLTTLFVGLRLISRHMKRADYGADDWLLILALFFYYTLTAALFIMVYPGWNGHRTNHVPDPDSALKWSTQVAFYSTLSYALVATCIRCSTCMLFKRVFITKAYRWMAYCNLAFNFCWGVYSVLIAIFRCWPITKGLYPSVSGHCIPDEEFLLSLTIWGVVCDAITWALPVPMVWRLHAPLSTKIGLTGILSLGLVAVTIGGLRIWTVVSISYVHDPLWELPLATYWAYTETGLGIVCSAAASIAPVFQRYFISPSKQVYRWLRSLTLIRSDSGCDQFTEETDHSSDPQEIYKSEWSLKTSKEGSHEARILALKHGHNADAHPDEVKMQTEISVTRDV